MRRITRAATVLTVALSTVPPLAGGVWADDTARCDEGDWPATVQGKPTAYHTGAPAGYYVWGDRAGWHLRTTTPTHRPHLFTGSIVGEDDIEVVRQVRSEGRDAVAVSGNAIRFRFVTYNGVDGIDFTVGCTEWLTFSLSYQGAKMSPRRIWLGRYGHARSNPFTVHRVA